VLEQLGVPHAEQRAAVYAERKQQWVLQLIKAGNFAAFPDAIRFVQAFRERRFPLAVASSSTNAAEMLRLIDVGSGRNLLELFDAVCSRDVRHGKPDPELFLLAASELGTAPERCLVVEDAPAGIEAAKSGGMTGLGVARHGDAALLQAAGADPVVTSLDEVSVAALAGGSISVWSL